MTGPEVIARKGKFRSGRVIVSAVALVLVWAALLGGIFGSGVLTQNENSGVAAACIVLLALVTMSDCVMFIYTYIKWRALPGDLIIFSEGKLFLAGRATELSDIVYVSDSGDKAAGNIVFSFKDGSVHTIAFADDARGAIERIDQLLASAAASDSGAARPSREVLGVKAKSGRYKVIVGCATAFAAITVLCILAVIAMFITAEDVGELIIATSSFSGIAVVCLCFFAFCIKYYRDYKMLPHELLTRCGDDLYYAGIKFNIGAIARVKYKGYPQGNCLKDAGVLTFCFNDGAKLKCRHFFQPHVIYRDVQNIIAQYNNQKN